MINKQNLWFITLFALILILGIYYISLPESTLPVFENTETKLDNAIKVTDSDVIIALKLSEEEKILKEMEDAQKILIDKSSSKEKKNEAYNTLKDLNYKKGKTESIEKKNSKPIGTGAYVLKKFEKTSGASLVSNSKFKAKKGQYQISKIMIKKTDTSTEVKELENGAVDYIPDVIEANKIKSVQKNKSLSVDSYPSDRESFIIFNSYAGACSDVAIRKAIGYGFNAQEYIDNYYQIDGMAYKPGTFGNPVSLNNGKMIRNEEKVDGVTYYDYDVEKANQILEDAGYTLAEDGYRYKDGEKLTIRFLANKDKDSLDSLIPVLQKCLNAIGIDFKANTVEFNTVINTVQDDAQTDSWDATYLGFSYGSPDDTGINFILRTGATNNFGRLSDEQLDAYLDAGMYTSDNDVSKENYHNALVRQSELCGYLPVDSTKTYCLRNKNIKGMHTTSIYNWAQSIATAYIVNK